jgi:hypothetical protein
LDYPRGTVTLKRGDVFTVVSLDDPGPYQLPVRLPITDADGWDNFETAAVPFRWHVVLIRDALVWIDHTSFECAELLRDVV